MEETKRSYYIDFIKGIAVISVIFLHNLPNDYILSIVWIGQAVPLFLIVSAYLTYTSFAKGKTLKAYYSRQSITKMLNRIFLPFFIVLALEIFIIHYLNIKELSITNIILSGGIGPGSYYPWLYLQCWLLLPIMIRITDAVSIKKSFLFFLLICIILEFVSSYIQIDPFIYRLSISKYLFIIYLGCLIKKENIQINSKFKYLAYFSLAFSLFQVYTPYNLEPFLINQWEEYNWITSFYPILVFLVLKGLYYKYKNTKVAIFFVKSGSYSYEIFLCQMFVYSVINRHIYDFMGNIYVGYLTFIVTSAILSIAPIFIYKEFLKKRIFSYKSIELKKE